MGRALGPGAGPQAVFILRTVIGGTNPGAAVFSGNLCGALMEGVRDVCSGLGLPVAAWKSQRLLEPPPLGTPPVCWLERAEVGCTGFVGARSLGTCAVCLSVVKGKVVGVSGPDCLSQEGTKL